MCIGRCLLRDGCAVGMGLIPKGQEKMKPLPWSHSSIEGHETCARKFEAEKVLREVQDVKNEASLWGDEVHRAFETFLNKGGAEPLPVMMQQYTPYISEYLGRPGTLLVEQQLAITIDLKPCGFFDKKVWARGIIDVLQIYNNVAWIDDHKTGKRKYNRQQLIIFALMVFYHHPEVTTCHTSYRWLQTGERDDETFYRHQIESMWVELLPKLERYARSFHAGVFNPRPSGLCKKHCAVDTCEYWGRGAR